MEENRNVEVETVEVCTDVDETSKQNRFKSWALWVSLAALIVLVVKKVWNIDVGETVNEIMDALLPVLVAFGVINNPTNKEGF